MLSNPHSRGDEKAALGGLEALASTDPQTAARELRGILARQPLNVEAYRLLALALKGIEQSSNSRGEVKIVGSGSSAAIERAAHALNANDFAAAEAILRRRLLERPSDREALYLMAKLADELNYDAEAEGLLRLAIELSPDFTAARIELARLLDKLHRPREAREELDGVLEREPQNLFAKATLAAALGRAGQYQEAVGLYEQLIQRLPEEAALWTTYGHLLKTMGRADDGLRAMREATRLAPHNGEAWWNLSNFKTVKFDAADIDTMRAATERPGLGNYDRFNLHFALGKAYEDLGNAAEAFAHYDRANAICRGLSSHSPEALSAEVTTSVNLFSRRFFEERAGWGTSSNDPIFVLGMPRAGSTLIEQILASHPEIEGTRELPDLPIIVGEIERSQGAYPNGVVGLDLHQLHHLGEEYLERTRSQRTTDRPFFVDKTPNNWRYVSLIHLLLPNAKIIDARRHPLACGFSNFKQNYVKGHAFSYDLATIGHYYHEYVRLMAHVDAVLPGRVHRVIHEQLVEDTEGEVRQMLDYLGLPFDPACLRFHETERAVRTPSAQQVRRPISRQGVDQWRMFDAWLEPLRHALGPVLDAYPEVPDFSE
jgi:tetratricopeptide (TPR) repeat protein